MKSLKLFATTVLLAGGLSFVFLGCKTAEHSTPTVTSGAVKPYPLSKCIVSGEPLEAGKAYTFVRDGQEFKLCCKDCLAEFDKNPKKFLTKLNDAR